MRPKQRDISQRWHGCTRGREHHADTAAGTRRRRCPGQQDEGQKPRAPEEQHTPSALPVPRQEMSHRWYPCYFKDTAAPATPSAILGITDKGPDLSSLLPSCFRAQSHSSRAPISPLPVSGPPPSTATKAWKPGTLQLPPRPVDAKESSPGTGGSTVRSRSGKAAPPHKPSNCCTAPAAAHITHAAWGPQLCRRQLFIVSVHRQTTPGSAKPREVMHSHQHAAALQGVQLPHRGEEKNDFQTVSSEGKRKPTAAATEHSKQPSVRGLFTPGTEMLVCYTREKRAPRRKHSQRFLHDIGKRRRGRQEQKSNLQNQQRETHQLGPRDRAGALARASRDRDWKDLLRHPPQV